MTPGRYLTTMEVAALLRLHPKTLRREWRALGLTAHRVGGRLRFPERDLERWQRDRKI
jgi:excisionase family DNA binding protein